MIHTHPCHDCNQEFTFDTSDFPMNAHSCLLVLQKVEMDGYSFYQCDGGQLTDYHTWQHWHCSHECMKRGLVTCVNEHHNEGNLSDRKFSQYGYFHKVVLSNGLLCKECGVPLKTVAYRFCLTMATPYNHVPDNTVDDQFAGWCCSLEHSIKSVLSTISNLTERTSH